MCILDSMLIRCMQYRSYARAFSIKISFTNQFISHFHIREYCQEWHSKTVTERKNQKECKPYKNFTLNGCVFTFIKTIVCTEQILIVNSL